MMKWIAIILSLILAGCTITVTPIKPSKKYRHSSKRYHKKSSSSAKPKPSEPTWRIKDAQWVEEYHKLQEEHGSYTIQDDANIEPLQDGRFKVPQAVIRHQQDLLLAKPTPDQ